MVEDIIAACGFDCSECPAYKATRGDTKEQERVAEKWSKAVKKKVTAEEILCDGCRVPDGRLVAFCAECGIRLCALAKGYPTCAHCPGLDTCGKFVREKTRERLRELKEELGV